MAAKRTIRSALATGAEERAASAGKRYFATVSTDPALGSFRVEDAPACHVIEVRDEDGNVIEVRRRPKLDHIEVHHEVEQLNNDTPVSRRSRGRLSGGNRTVKDSGIKLGEVTMPSPTEIVARMVYPGRTVPTHAKLKALQESGGKLKRAEVPGLIEQVAPREWRAFNQLSRIDGRVDKFVEAVYQQLSRKFNI